MWGVGLFIFLFLFCFKLRVFWASEGLVSVSMGYSSFKSRVWNDVTVP